MGMGKKEPGTTAIGAGDNAIGGVELKNATDDTRAKVGAGSGLVTGDNALAVSDPTNAAILTSIKTAVEIMDDWDDGSDRAQVDVAAQTLTAMKVSATAAANTLGNPMFTQISQDGTNAMSASYPLPISATMAANAVSNPIFVSLSDGTGLHLSTTYPGYIRLQDGDSGVLGDIVDTHADALALSLNGLNTASFTYLYNGASMDLARSGASGELQVTDVATRPGEDAGNDWRKVKKEATKTYAPAKITTTINEADEVILASTEIIGWPNITLTIYNTHGENDFTDCVIMLSPDGTTWEEWDETTFAILEATTMKSMQISGNSRRYIKVTASATADTGSADVWLTGNAG